MKATISLFVWILVVTYLSLAPVYEAGTYILFPYEDKLAHFGFYFIMSCLFSLALPVRELKSYILIFLFPSAFGYFMEILQEQLETGRMFDYFDILANIFGAFTGTMLFYILNKSKG